MTSDFDLNRLLGMEQDEKNDKKKRYQAFFKKQAETPNTVATGFCSLDKLLDGGLHPELYIIGALSSLGKTTFCLQIADHISSKGFKVLFVSLEQGEMELVSKSISRMSYEHNKDHALTAWEVMNGQHNDAVFPLLDEYVDAHNMIILERSPGNNEDSEQLSAGINMGIIKKQVKEHVKDTDNNLVLFIDYLQIIPGDTQLTDKQRVDRHMYDLKQISVKYNIPVVVISSLNRESYNTTMSLSSFKESGNIEYDTDVIIGLQPKEMKNAKNDKEKANNKGTLEEHKRKDIRDIEVVILKNRKGRGYGEISFTYNAKHNHFEERWTMISNEKAADKLKI